MINRRSAAIFPTLFLLTGIWLAPGATAQSTTATNGAQVLTADEAVSIALENNLGLKSAQRTIGIAQGQLTTAGLLPYNPELSLQLFNARPRGGVTASGREYSLALSQRLEIGGQRGYRRQVASANIGRVSADISFQQWMLETDVRESFYQIVLLRQKLEVAERVLNLTRDLATLTEGKFKQGYSPEFDVRFAEVEYQRALRERTRLANQLEIAKYQLNNLLGRPPEIPFTAADSLQYEPASFSLERLTAAALQQRRDLRSVEFERQAASSEISLARAQRLPDLQFSLIYDREQDKNRVGGFFSIPIKLFNRNQGRITSSQARQSAAEARASYLRTVITKEVASAYTQLLLAGKEVELMQRGILRPVAENLDLVRRAYQIGEVEILAVITAQRTFVETQNSYLDALFAYQAAQIDLARAVGIPLRELR
jgi:cobalt-zinc-cadmium efflux system outer membrane protein